METGTQTTQQSLDLLVDLSVLLIGLSNQPLGPNSVKIVSRIENWPYRTPNPNNASSGSDGRKLMIRGYTHTTLLPREDAGVLGGYDKLPFFVYSGRHLTEPVGPVAPADKIANYDFVFRHRYFNLSIGFLENSTACATPNDTNCEWRDIDVAGLAYGSNAQILQRLIAQVPYNFNPEEIFKLETDVFIGMVANGNPVVEWDPNLDIIFGDGYEASYASGTPGASGGAPTLAEFASANAANLALYIAIPAAVVVVIIVIIIVFIYRRKTANDARIKVQRMMSRRAETSESSPAVSAITVATVEDGRPVSVEPTTPRGGWAAPQKPYAHR